MRKYAKPTTQTCADLAYIQAGRPPSCRLATGRNRPRRPVLLAVVAALDAPGEDDLPADAEGVVGLVLAVFADNHDAIDSERRTAASSSTTWTVRSAGIVSPIRRNRCQREVTHHRANGKSGPPAELAVRSTRLAPAAMGIFTMRDDETKGDFMIDRVN